MSEKRGTHLRVAVAIDKGMGPWGGRLGIVSGPTLHRHILLSPHPQPSIIPLAWVCTSSLPPPSLPSRSESKASSISHLHHHLCHFPSQRRRRRLFFALSAALFPPPTQSNAAAHRSRRRKLEEIGHINNGTELHRRCATHCKMGCITGERTRHQRGEPTGAFISRPSDSCLLWGTSTYDFRNFFLHSQTPPLVCLSVQLVRKTS